jgi:hypothetical protein
MQSPKTFRRRAVAVLACLCVTGLTAFQANAFGTINSLGQSAEHEKITRLALAPFGLGPRTMSEIAGRSGTFGAVGAPDRPDRGLMSTKAAHCDEGDFLSVPGYPHARADAIASLEGCRDWITRQLQTAVREAGALVDSRGRIRDSEIPTFVSCTYNGQSGRAKCNALEALGLAFHAAQDFYSHTNWTDQAQAGPTGLANPPGLGNTSRSPWLDPRRKSQFPEGLLSGCFKAIPEKLFCKDRVKHETVNKDTGSIDVASGSIGQGRTPRGRVNDNFARAVRAAIEDTRDKWAYFETRVLATYGRQSGPRVVCAIRRDDPSGCR